MSKGLYDIALDDKAAALVGALKGKEELRVLFVCLGNICRSPAAEEVMRQTVDDGGEAYRWHLDSAGTGGWHVGDLPDRRMRIHALRRGYELTHICRQVRTADFDSFDIIIGMDANNVSDLKALAPTVEAADKVVAMGSFIDPGMGFDHIPDPYYEGAEGFERVLDLLANATHRLFEVLKK